MEEEDKLHELAKKATLNFNPMSPLHKKVEERRTTELIEVNPVDEYRRAPLSGHLGEQDHPYDLPHPYVGEQRLASWGNGQLPAPARELL